jgi:hypothetical protein
MRGPSLVSIAAKARNSMHSELPELSAVIAFGVLYAVPSIVALRERPITVAHVEAIIVNALLGWTIIGWAFALFLALDRRSEDATAGLLDHGPSRY